MLSVDLKDRLLSKQSAFSALIVIVAFWLLFRYIDFVRVWQVMKGTNPLFYLAALALYYIPFLFRGERWRLLLRKAGIKTSLREATEVTFLSFFVNNVVPAQLGDLYRGHLLGARIGESRSRITGTVFVDRILDFVSLVLGATVLGYFVVAAEWSNLLQYVQIGYVFLAVIGMAVLFLLFEGSSRLVPARFRQMFERFREGVKEGLSWSNALPVAFYTALIWLFVVLRVYVVVMALSIEMKFAVVAFLALFMIMLTIIPFTPAGLGAVEVLSTGFLALVGVSAAEALSVVLLDRTITYVSVVVFGAVFYMYTEKRVI